MFKKNKLIGIVCLIMAALVSFSSCSKEQQIVGKWKITKAKFGSYSTDDDIWEAWTFKDGGKCILFISGAEFEGQYSINKNTMFIDVEYYFQDGYGSYAKLTGDLDMEEYNNKEMSVSGKVKLAWYDYDGLYDTEQLNMSYELKRN